MLLNCFILILKKTLTIRKEGVFIFGVFIFSGCFFLKEGGNLPVPAHNCNFLCCSACYAPPVGTFSRMIRKKSRCLWVPGAWYTIYCTWRLHTAVQVVPGKQQGKQQHHVMLMLVHIEVRHVEASIGRITYTSYTSTRYCCCIHARKLAALLVRRLCLLNARALLES